MKKRLARSFLSSSIEAETSIRQNIAARAIGSGPQDAIAVAEVRLVDERQPAAAALEPFQLAVQRRGLVGLPDCDRDRERRLDAPRPRARYRRPARSGARVTVSACG